MFASTPALAMGDSVLVYESTVLDWESVEAQSPSAETSLRERHMMNWGKKVRKKLQTLSL
jgi:hypothetical protein